MKKSGYTSMKNRYDFNRREFIKASSVLGTALMLGTPDLFADDNSSPEADTRTKTNIEDALSAPRNEFSLPGKYPGKTVEVIDTKAMTEDRIDAVHVKKMFESGLESLSDKKPDEFFKQLFVKNDVVGIKVNPVGPGLISTRLEVVDAVIDWLTRNGIKKENIIIWDRFDYMLADAGFTLERFPGISIVGLQTMDEAAAAGESEDNSGWLDENGKHISENNFDLKNYYWADVEAPQDMSYLNQHVFNGKYSYFGKLLTEKITKIINIPVFKNTGNGISMATKNLGYGAICNTGRLHRPLFFDVCTEVLAFPAIRDKLVLNITDGLRCQYEGGPMAAAEFTYIDNRLYLSTDPFALDMYCHNKLVQKRKDMGIRVNEHPMFTQYLHYSEELGIGVVDKEKVQNLKVEL